MKHISNEEKAREIVEQYETRYNTCDLLWQDLEDVALQAMKWKDKERKELWRITRNHYQEWAEEREQQLIDKAAEWLRMTMDFFNNGEFNTEKFVNDFKKEMKGE